MRFALLATCALCSAQTVTVQANPIPMKTFGKISGLSERQYGLWHITARNQSSAVVQLDFVAIQQCFPEVGFLTAAESEIVLTRDQQNSPWNIVLDLGKDAQLAAAAFLSPWALVATPLIQQGQKQIQNRAPNEAKLLAVIASTANQTLQPGAGAVSTMLAGVTHGAHEERCTLTAKPVPEPTTPRIMLVPVTLPAGLGWIRNEVLGL